jgi:PAS domain S-box-containing protein
MKRNALLVGLILLFGFASFQLFSSFSHSQTTIIKVGIDPNAPPIEFNDNGEARGFNVDLMQKVADNQGWTVEFIFMEWTAVLESVTNGSLDLMFATYTEERDEIYDFSKPILNITWRIYVQEQVVGISDLSDISGRTVAVVKDFAEHDYLAQIVPDAIIIPVDSVAQGLELLELGDVFAFFGQQHMVQYYLQFHEESRIKTIGNTYPYRSMSITVKSGRTDLLNQINSALNIMFSNGQYNEIYERWYGFNIDREKLDPALSRYLIYGGFVLIGIILILATWSYSLRVVVRRQVKELDETRNFYRKLVEMSPFPAAITSRDGSIEYFNPKVTQTLGYTLRELPNTKVWFEKLYPDPAYRNYVLSEWAKSIEDFPNNQDRVWEFKVQTKSGRVLQMEFRLVMIGTDRAYVIMNDISDRAAKEDEVRRQQKLESLSLLAGGIAHDFNNILMTLLGSINLLQMEEELKPDSKELVDAMEKATLRARSITNQLLTFSKGGQPVRKIQAIEPILRESVNFAMQGSNCSATFNIDPELPPVNLDAGQFAQVIHNLILNAIQAMPEGGPIQIKARLAKIDEIKKANLGDHDYLRISIIDAGSGIPEDAYEKIFTPYFTTKSKGTGLGLATSYSIIKNHGGTNTFKSKLSRGTTFYLFLPIEKGIQKEDSNNIKKWDKFSGRILVLDDDQNVIKVISPILTQFGFEVTAVADGAEVINIYRQALNEQKPFTVVLMDLTIPGGLGGKDTIELLRQIDPHVKAIVFSGYSNDPVLANYEQYGFIGALQKPFTMNDLHELFAKILKK